jgi:hypothetical protein
MIVYVLNCFFRQVAISFVVVVTISEAQILHSHTHEFFKVCESASFPSTYIWCFQTPHDMGKQGIENQEHGDQIQAYPSRKLLI